MNDLFFWAMVGTAFGIGSFFYGFKQLRKKRLIENTPTSKVRSMALGLVEVHGKSLAISPLTAPFSQMPCVYYRYQVEELRRGNKRAHWVTIHSGDSLNAPFYLQDETGQVLVNPQASEVEIPDKFNLQTGFLKDVPEHIM